MSSVFFMLALLAPHLGCVFKLLPHPLHPLHRRLRHAARWPRKGYVERCCLDWRFKQP